MTERPSPCSIVPKKALATCTCMVKVGFVRSTHRGGGTGGDAGLQQFRPFQLERQLKPARVQEFDKNIEKKSHDRRRDERHEETRENALAELHSAGKLRVALLF